MDNSWAERTGRRRGLIVGRLLESGTGFGFVQQPAALNGPLAYDGDAHLTTFAPTGAGKGRSVLVPVLLSDPRPMVVLDVKGELYGVTARRRRAMGHRVVLLDPFRRVAAESDGLNPLDVFKLAGADIETDAQSLASLLAAGNLGGKDPFWDLNACGLHSGLLAHLATARREEDRHLPALKSILQGGDAVYQIAVMLDNEGKTMNRFAYEELVAFLNHAERETRPSVLSTAVSYIKAFGSRRVAQTLERTTFSLADFIDGAPQTIYIVIPPDRLESHKALIKLWFGTLLKAVVSRQHIPPQRTLFLLDECGQLGSFPMLQTAITLCRGYGLQCWTFWQDLSQLKSNYPETWRSLLNNSGVIQVFGVNHRELAMQWSDYLEQSPAELLGLEPHEQIVRIAGRGEFRASKLDYLRDPEFSGLYDPNPYFAHGGSTRQRSDPALGA